MGHFAWLIESIDRATASHVNPGRFQTPDLLNLAPQTIAEAESPGDDH